MTDPDKTRAAAAKAHALASNLPELAAPFVRTSPVRIPELHNVALTRRVLAVVDHPDFQRLRLIRQLGPTHLVYPGAVHTRFEHSLGVFDAVRRYLNTLLQNPVFTEGIEEVDLLTVLAAALIHDVGHYPLAHNLEALHHKGEETPCHEQLASDIVTGRLTTAPNTPPIGEVFRSQWGVDPYRACGLITRKWADQETQVDRVLASIISSPLDADKMDYLERDSIHMGVPYGRNWDKERFLSSLTVTPEGDRIAISDKGRVSAEIFVFGRYTMFSEAYWHHTVRSASSMAERSLSDWRARTGISMADLVDLLFRSSDESLTEHVHDTAPEGSRGKRLMRGLLGGRRNLYKRVVTLSLVHLDPRKRAGFEMIFPMSSEQVTRLEDRMRHRLNSLAGAGLEDGDVIVDTPPRGKDKLGMVPVVLGRDGHPVVVPLEKISMIVQGIAQDFAKVVKKIRVFIAPDALERVLARSSRPALQNAVVEEILRAPDSLPF